MKIDFYTKAVLTIIAVCLIIIVFKEVEIFPGAYASSPASSLESNINYGLVPLNADGSIDVNIKSSSTPMEMDIDAVDGLAFSLCTVPVKIK